MPENSIAQLWKALLLYTQQAKVEIMLLPEQVAHYTAAFPVTLCHLTEMQDCPSRCGGLKTDDSIS